VLAVVGWTLAGVAGVAGILGLLGGALAERAERQLHAPEPLPQSVVSLLCAGWALWGLLTASVSTGGPHGPAVRVVHAAVVGRTGRGKTACINTVIYGALRHGGHVWVADPKGVDYRWVDSHPSARRYPEENAPYVIRHAMKEMNSRRRWLMERGAGAVKISDVERDDRPPHLLVVLDELLEILVEGPKKKDEEGRTKRFTGPRSSSSSSSRRDVGTCRCRCW
jgi:hypothetical protein